MSLLSADDLQRLASDPTTSAFVSASAGSGKTKVLVDRVLNLLLSNALPEKILCLTFTRAAAAEMANRINERLSVWATCDEAQLQKELSSLLGNSLTHGHLTLARQLFAKLLDTAGGLKIMTIHAFCQSVLKRFPVEANVSPHFEILDEPSAADLLNKAQNRVLGRLEFKNDLEFITQITNEDGFTKILKTMTSSLQNLEDLHKKYNTPQTLERVYEQALELPHGVTQESLLLDFCMLTPTRTLSLQEAQEILSKGKGIKDKNAATNLKNFLLKPFENYHAYITVFLKNTGEIKDKLTHKDTALAQDIMLDEAKRVLQHYQTQKSLTLKDVSLVLVRIGIAIMHEYKALKSGGAFLDYFDLISKTNALLQTKEECAWVLYKLDGGIDHILVDEAQDTSLDQWSIICALVEDFFSGNSARTVNRTLFVVGDKKQSIFSFQGADPYAFEAMRVHFKNKVEGAGKKWADIPMYTSFRSTPAVIDLVNRVLQNPQARIGVLEDGEDGTHLYARKGQAGLVEIWPSCAPEETDTSTYFTKPVERVVNESSSLRLARLMAKKIADMVNNKELLLAQNRQIEPNDILVLVKKRDAFMNDLSLELKRLQIPVCGIDRLKITSHIAVMDLMVLGDFLLLNEDDLALATVLRSPLCNIDEQDLFNLSYDRFPQTLLTRLALYKNQPDTKLGQAYILLTDLLTKVDKLRPFELYAYVLYALGKQKQFVARLGAQALDALDEFMSLVLNFETQHTPSLQHFLYQLRQNDVEIKRDPDQKTFNAVRMMTVHGAKGLQAPIVFLPDTQYKKYHPPQYFWFKDIPLWTPRSENRSNVVLPHIDSLKRLEDEEYNRLLYVALTRASDRLYVCSYRKKTVSKNNWYDLIKSSVFLTKDGVQVCLVDQKTDPMFQEDVLYIQSDQKQELPQKKNALKELNEVSFPAYISSPVPLEPSPPKPLVPSKIDQEEDVFLSPIHHGRQNALKRGVIIHQLLEILPKYRVQDQYALAVEILKDTSDREPLIQSVLNIVQNPQFKDLFGSDSLAEIPVSGIVDGSVISGQIDRLCVTDTDVFIVDYKSNLSVPERTHDIPTAYLKQMNAYKKLIQKLYPKKIIRSFLLWTEVPLLMEVTHLV